MRGPLSGDEEGEFTFIGGKGSTVIDYAIINYEARERTVKFKDEDRVESDHAPISLKISLKGTQAENRHVDSKINNGSRRKKVISWSEEAIRIFTAQREEVDEEENRRFSGKKMEGSKGQDRKILGKKKK